jgi:N4-gp56 family major capsid protein
VATTELIGVAGMTNELKTFYSKQLLARLVPALEHANHGLAEDIPPHAGKAIEKRRFESYTAQTTALTEGTAVLSSAINGTWTALTFTVSQYGAFALVSDVLAQQGFDGLDDMVNAFGENAGNSIDQIIRDSIVAGGTVIYASTAASRGGLASGMRLTNVEVRKAVRKLRVNNAKTFDDGYYHAIIHPDSEYDLMSDSSIVNVYQYAADRGEDNPLIQGAVPAIYGAKFYRTSNAKIFPTAGQTGTSATDVYITLFVGRDAYLVSRFGTQNVRTIIKPIGTAGPLDPLDQFGSIGWKASVVAGILQANALIRVEHTSSLASNGNG